MMVAAAACLLVATVLAVSFGRYTRRQHHDRPTAVIAEVSGKAPCMFSGRNICCMPAC